MSTASLDSFQLIVGLYLLYIAIKGKGQMYRFGDIPEEERQRIHRPLRLLYLLGGLIATAEFGVCTLQNSMFTRTVTDSGAVEISQNFALERFPFLTYDLLSVVSSVMTILVILLLAGIFVWLRVLSARNRGD